ncbi:membrane protein insertase YidC [Undibacterium cyanobacteriorum]|uniref:Membrane protein insertase YidC n=1 Tax=Undibacterium cyanobacteriorum TaxID=3073561 RepID=A0ABY9RK72_9BURK|nr:membrane protein insertase YidC [Undibacterium sp. 20NA77.5]WMW80757.1 membrane protein insertase YidC [Undibacterium sp. 20NA77.5]
MDIKRTFLWVIFTMSLVLLWDKWMQHTGKNSMFFPKPVAQQTQAASASASASANATAASAAAVSTPTATTTAADGTVTPVKSETITITTDVVKADIDTIGGEIKRLELLKYADSVDAKKNVVLFDHTADRTYAAQTGLIGAKGLDHHAGYIALPGNRDIGNGNEISLVLETQSEGVKLTKTYTFKKGDYVIGVKHELTNNTNAPIAPSLYLQLIHDGTKPKSGGMFSGTTEFYAPALYTEEKFFQKLSFEDIEKRANKAKETKKPDVPDHPTSANNGWVSIIQHFFVSAFILDEKVEREVFTKKVAETENLYAIGNVVKYPTVAPGQTAAITARLYSGPQETATLEKIAPGLDLVKDYWKLSMLAKPMFWLMELIHKFIGNWGWTIVLFTIGIKLALFPLSAAGFRSMAKMKVLTPKMTALKEKYKNEPQKLNQAMMELYKTEKINPLGGCLPMLIQMPIFLALYWVLQASVEMRGAPWVGWITDLTQPDPWFILPVLYAISMYITTKLNPAPADPIQAKMMLFMPLMFSVMFIFFPSGLVLYWVVNNILSIAQQWVINNKIVPPEHRS